MLLCSLAEWIGGSRDRILTRRFGLTVIVTVLLVAGLLVVQVSLEVMMHDIRSPETGVYV